MLIRCCRHIVITNIISCINRRNGFPPWPPTQYSTIQSNCPSVAKRTQNKGGQQREIFFVSLHKQSKSSMVWECLDLLNECRILFICSTFLGRQYVLVQSRIPPASTFTGACQLFNTIQDVLVRRYERLLGCFVLFWACMTLGSKEKFRYLSLIRSILRVGELVVGRSYQYLK